MARSARSVSDMATEAVRRGPTAETVRANVKRIREKRGLSLRALAKLTDDTDNPIGHGAINQIEQGRRRVDVDDLMTLAFALNVPPPALLLPRVTHEQRNEAVPATGVGRINAGALWGWVKCQFQPVEISKSADTNEFGVNPDYRVAVGTWIIGIDEREHQTAQNQIERRRKSKLFDLFDLYYDDYLEYVEETREYEPKASDMERPPGGVKGLRAALGLQPDSGSDDA